MSLLLFSNRLECPWLGPALLALLCPALLSAQPTNDHFAAASLTGEQATCQCHAAGRLRNQFSRDAAP